MDEKGFTWFSACFLVTALKNQLYRNIIGFSVAYSYKFNYVRGLVNAIITKFNCIAIVLWLYNYRNCILPLGIP